jgi:antitoxin component YwqK of YwqJK toxin-antitoxin module
MNIIDLPSEILGIVFEFLKVNDLRQFTTCNSDIMKKVKKNIFSQPSFVLSFKKDIESRVVEWMKINDIKHTLHKRKYKYIRDHCTISVTFTNGIIHSDNDEPARIIHYNGSMASIEKQWYKNGELHRENDLPAILKTNELIRNSNSQIWYKNGKKHRDNDLPAEIYDNGTQFWYINGVSQKEPSTKRTT